jgi:hypothetical protein
VCPSGGRLHPGWIGPVSGGAEELFLHFVAERGAVGDGGLDGLGSVGREDIGGVEPVGQGDVGGVNVGGGQVPEGSLRGSPAFWLPPPSPRSRKEMRPGNGAELCQRRSRSTRSKARRRHPRVARRLVTRLRKWVARRLVRHPWSSPRAPEPQPWLKLQPALPTRWGAQAIAREAISQRPRGAEGRRVRRARWRPRARPLLPPHRAGPCVLLALPSSGREAGGRTRCSRQGRSPRLRRRRHRARQTPQLPATSGEIGLSVVLARAAPSDSSALASCANESATHGNAAGFVAARACQRRDSSGP